MKGMRFITSSRLQLQISVVMFSACFDPVCIVLMLSWLKITVAYAVGMKTFLLMMHVYGCLLQETCALLRAT